MRGTRQSLDGCFPLCHRHLAYKKNALLKTNLRLRRVSLNLKDLPSALDALDGRNQDQTELKEPNAKPNRIQNLTEFETKPNSKRMHIRELKASPPPSRGSSPKSPVYPASPRRP